MCSTVVAKLIGVKGYRVLLCEQFFCSQRNVKQIEKPIDRTKINKWIRQLTKILGSIMLNIPRNIYK